MAQAWAKHYPEHRTEKVSEHVCRLICLCKWNELQQQAVKEEISASAIIRRLVREYLEQVKQKERKK